MSDEDETRELTLERARTAIELRTGKRHRLVIRLPQLFVRLLGDPSTPPSQQAHGGDGDSDGARDRCWHR